MDGTANFGGGYGADDAAIEAPANVGTDERRMHVRAYNYWVSLLDGRAYPSIEDLNPEDLEDFGPNSVLLDFTAGIENPAVSFLGHRLRLSCDLPEDLGSIEQIPPRSLLSRLTDHFMQIIANRAPIGFEAEYTNEAGVDILYRGILMPFSSDDDTIDFIYGVINWKEALGAAPASLLQEEVARALDHVPAVAPRRDVAPMPAFADGPGSAAAVEPAPARSLADLSDPVPFVEEASDVLELGMPVPHDGDALADWLAAARYLADEAEQSNVRGRQSLYRALGMAYDFALAARERNDEYRELLDASGIVEQARAPMTPVVKLVFGIGYDKTRLAEYALALSHGMRANVVQGDFAEFVDRYDGALKGIVKAERALKRPVKAAKPAVEVVERARALTPRGIVEAAGSDEFVVLVARRVDAEHVAVLGEVVSDKKMIEKALSGLLD
jgi:hypothetical protein